MSTDAQQEWLVGGGYEEKEEWWGAGTRSERGAVDGRRVTGWSDLQ